MKIPFALHRRIPAVRRVLEMRDDLMKRLHDETLLRERETRVRMAAEARVDELEKELASRPPARGPLDPEIVCVADQMSGHYAREILSLLAPMDVVDGNLVRKGHANDGGYVMLNSGLRNATAYSLGINDDVSWDLDMAALGCQVYQYDHTIEKLPEENPAFHWFKTKIAPSSGPGNASIDDLIRANGHTGRRDLILKMDIESAEWDVFDALPESTLAQFSQIVMEMHHFALAPARLPQMTRVLKKIGMTHQSIHIHANNWGAIGLVGGTFMPDAMEVTYVRRGDHTFSECRRVFPTAIDQPCRPDVPEYFLGAIGALTAREEAVID